MEHLSVDLSQVIKHIQQAFGSQACWREHALIQDLKRAQIEPLNTLNLSNTLELFKAHFLVRHALYTLRNQWRSAQTGELDIGTIEITKHCYSNTNEHSALQTKDLLADYYLDLENYTEMTEAEVNLLLKGFWQQLQNPSQSSQALKTLGLTQGATYREIKAAFRKAAQLEHPDKGGDESKFKALVEAKETLLDRG